jgi:REP element-mobilizing transposase RayT
MPPPAPLYTAANCNVAYQLNWSLSVFWTAPSPSPAEWLDALRSAVEPDGVRILEHHPRSPTVSQFFLSTKPQIPPFQAVHSVKGRLQYLVRQGLPRAFHRNYAIHSVGSARDTAIRNYIRDQVSHHPRADQRVQQRLAAYQIHAPEVDLSQARRSSHGEFSHNLHLVLVQDGRWSEIRDAVLGKIRDTIQGASRKKGHLLAEAGILPDHIHLALGCDVTEAPLDVALSYLNNLAYAQEMKPVYQYGCYLGTFGAYDRGAIRARHHEEPAASNLPVT